MGREIRNNSIFGLETSKGEAGILIIYCGFSPKEEWWIIAKERVIHKNL